MGYFLLFVIGVPVFALAFAGTVKFLGLFWGRFETSGPGGFTMLFTKMLLVAAVYVLLSLAGIGGLLGLAVMALCYKSMFGAGWVEALVIGVLGGLVGWALFIVTALALTELGMKLT